MKDAIKTNRDFFTSLDPEFTARLNEPPQSDSSQQLSIAALMKSTGSKTSLGIIPSITDANSLLSSVRVPCLFFHSLSDSAVDYTKDVDLVRFLVVGGSSTPFAFVAVEAGGHCAFTTMRNTNWVIGATVEWIQNFLHAPFEE